MSHSDRFPVDPWQVCETALDLSDLAPAESLFALSNGHIGVRGTFDEGDPSGLPGTYLNSFYESRPLPYAEAGYGYPESGQTVVPVTDGTLIRLVVDDEPFDVRYGSVHQHLRTLDLRGGLLHRDVVWETPAGKRIGVRSTRLVSLAQRSILAIRYEVRALDEAARVVVQSELVANQKRPAQSNDPRVAALMEAPLEHVATGGEGHRSWLVHQTRGSGLMMAAAMDHRIDCDARVSSREVRDDDWSRLTLGTLLQPGETLVVTKFVAYGWSSQRGLHALRDQADAAIASALNAGWDSLVADQAAALTRFWDGADVRIEGDPAVQQAVRFALFHAYQAAARAEQRAIPAKGLTGPGYDGHAFWDTECFVLPMLTATAPDAARDALIWRRTTLDLAVERAEMLRLAGATFPWRTIRGQECSGYWPAGSAAFHVNADVAVAALRHLRWTGDEQFGERTALPILVATARMWCSLGYHGEDGRFHIDGVTGPDEYSAIVDDNAYTNLMARQNLLGAADLVARWPDAAAMFEVDDAEITAWREAADAMALHYDKDREVYSQDRDFTSHQVWDFEETDARDGYPLLLHSSYFDIYRKQVVKQADLILAMHWAGDRFSLEEKARAFAYYDPLTVRDSSLSACTQAVIAAEVGQLDLAADYLAEAALMDLRDLQHNSRNGLHIASLAGTWLAIVAGFGGMRDFDDRLSFHPQLPKEWTEYEFRLRWRGRRLSVRVADGSASYLLLDGEDLEVVDCDDVVGLTAGEPVLRPLQPVEPLTERPGQPAGRVPVSHRDLEQAIQD